MAEATYGGFWIRSLAYAADMSILTLALLLLAVPFVFAGGVGAALFGLIAAVGPIAYFAWLTASERQATFGKQLCGLRVRQADAAVRISLLRSIARELAKFLSAAILLIGFLLIAFTGRKQGLHDMLASTEVVREGPARIMVAILVALAGVLVPIVVISTIFGAFFASFVATMLGASMGTNPDAIKMTQKAPALEKKVALPPAAPSAPAAAVPAPKPAAGESDELEAVYRKFHAATLAADMDELRKWGTKAKGDELVAASEVERKMIFGLMAQVTPKVYKATSSEVSADGKTAMVRLRAEVTDKGKTEEVRGTAILLREGGAWKVDRSIWGGEQPPGLAARGAPAGPAKTEPAKPVIPEPAKPMAAEQPKPVAAAPAFKQAQPAPASQPKAAPRRSEPVAATPVAPTLRQGKSPCVYKSVMTDEEIERCR